MNRPGDVLPDKQVRRGLFRSIWARLTVSFTLGFIVVAVLIELAGIAGIPFTSYEGRLGQRKAEAFRNLNLIADIKQQRLLRLLEEFRDDVHVFATNDMVAETVAELHAAAARLADAGESEGALWPLVRKEPSFGQLVRYLNEIKQTYEAYDEIQIIDTATERVLVSTDQKEVGSDVSDQPYFAGPLTSHDAYVGPVTAVAKSSTPIFHVSHLICGHDAGSETRDQREDRPLAVLAMRVNTDDIIQPILYTSEELGGSGEALLVNREGRILTSLKHRLPDGTVPQPLRHKITAKPAALAVEGKEGIIDSRDYRGEPVLAAYRHIRIAPQLGWGLVVKLDKTELFAPLREDVVYILWLELVGVLAFVAIATILAGSLTRPIRALSQTAEKVAAGDLSARGSVGAAGEVGLLATTFNTMIERVENWHTELKSEVQARTADLRRINERLAAEIADRKQIEAALAKSEIFLNATGRTAKVGGWELDAETKEVRWTDQTYHIYEVPLDYKPSLDGALSFFHPDDRAELALAIQRAIDHGEPYDMEIRFITAKGNPLWTHTICKPHVANGKTIKLTGTFQDITRRKLAEQEREMLIAELEAKNAELERFTYTVSHDLKSPLITIKGYLGLLREDMADGKTDAVEDHVTRVAGAADKMGQLLRELLELSRIGRMVNPSEHVDLGELAREAVELVGGQIDQQRVQVEIAADLPVVFGDRQRLLEVLQNLIDNAVKYMGEQPRPHIEIGTRLGRGDRICYIRDNGMGIEPNYHEKIFGLFNQLDRTVEGSGIGLALVKRIIETHGGRIWVESEGSGQGSTFCFIVPSDNQSAETPGRSHK